MLLLLLSQETVFSQQIPVNIANDSDTQSEQVPAPLPIIAVVGTIKQHTQIFDSYNSTNSTSNAKFSSFLQNLGYEIPYSFQNYAPDSFDIKVFTLTGKDSVAKAINQTLIDLKVDTKFIEFSDKFPSSISVEMVHQQQEDSEEEIEHEKELFSNTDSFFQINYKYIYKQKYPLMQASHVFLDSQINENAIRFILEGVGSKTAIYVQEGDEDKLLSLIQKMKVKKDANVMKFLQLSQNSANNFLESICKLSNQTDCEDLKLPVKNVDSYKMIFGALHNVFHAENILIKADKQLLSLSGVGLVEVDNKLSHNTNEFLSCFATSDVADIEAKIEHCGFVEICQAKGVFCSPKERKRLEQISYVSQKWIVKGAQPVHDEAQTEL
ncbi:hypothetical protein SS50377_26160 [Spironucleus salmonicida]|uniref:Uncharacterized protein n=1 Tax=Spironucleus salmonicida TaxID=348837 RepID=V6LKK9_9EUKA|nr:hypothetical protein SS50377_26160 [Spironucleus salmonicida]|eukprot:EST44893.1 Hypothetical protein SS50377_15184 [Spironucleus salmonicida]